MHLSNRGPLYRTAPIRPTRRSASTLNTEGGATGASRYGRLVSAAAANPLAVGSAAINLTCLLWNQATIHNTHVVEYTNVQQDLAIVNDRLTTVVAEGKGLLQDREEKVLRKVEVHMANAEAKAATQTALVKEFLAEVAVARANQTVLLKELTERVKGNDAYQLEVKVEKLESRAVWLMAVIGAVTLATAYVDKKK